MWLLVPLVFVLSGCTHYEPCEAARAAYVEAEGEYKPKTFETYNKCLNIYYENQYQFRGK